MNSKLFIRQLSLLILLIAQVVVLHGEGVGVDLKSSKSEYLLGEPVLVRLVFSNGGNKSVQIPADLNVMHGGLRFYISRDNSKYNRIIPVAELDPSGQSIEIKSEDKFAHDEILALDARTNGTLFPASGRYFIRVYETNVIEVKITNPKTKAESEASEIFRTKEVLHGIAGLELTKKAIDNLERCLAEATAFRPYAALFLADNKKQPSEALTLLRDADQVDFPLRSHAVYLRGRLFLKMGQRDKAYHEFRRVLQEFPESGPASDVIAKRLLDVAERKNPQK